MGLKKPLVKEFFDKDAEVEKFLLIRLPEFPNYQKVNIIKLFTKKDGVTHKYRVNWFAANGDIPLSQYVEVVTTKDGHVVSHSIQKD